MYKNRKLAAYIDGRWIESQNGAEFPSINPANKKDVIGVFTESGKDQVREAAHAARKAYKTWSQTPAPVRASVIGNFGRLIEANKEELA